MYVLAHKKTLKTGRKIAEALQNLTDRDIPAQREFRPMEQEFIRWGNARNPDRDFKCLLNNGKAILLAGDKLASLKKFEAAGIPIPQYAEHPEDIDDQNIWFGRRKRGFGGMDIKIKLAGDEAPPGFYDSEFFTRYIPNDREYRIHVVKDEIIRLQRKYLEDETKTTEQLISNHRNGYVFKAPQKGLREARYEIARESVRCLGLDFGAVDMIVDYEGDPFILEVNTAPGCSPITIDAYAKAFERVLNGSAEGT